MPQTSGEQVKVCAAFETKYATGVEGWFIGLAFRLQIPDEPHRSDEDSSSRAGNDRNDTSAEDEFDMLFGHSIPPMYGSMGTSKGTFLSVV